MLQDRLFMEQMGKWFRTEGPIFVAESKQKRHEMECSNRIRTVRVAAEADDEDGDGVCFKSKYEMKSDESPFNGYYTLGILMPIDGT